MSISGANVHENARRALNDREHKANTLQKHRSYGILWFSFEGAYPYLFMAQWLSWLERRPVTAEVVGSSPIWVAFFQSGPMWLNWQSS